jgi:hypothetical protein
VLFASAIGDANVPAEAASVALAGPLSVVVASLFASVRSYPPLLLFVTVTVSLAAVPSAPPAVGVTGIATVPDDVTLITVATVAVTVEFVVAADATTGDQTIAATAKALVILYPVCFFIFVFL